MQSTTVRSTYFTTALRRRRRIRRIKFLLCEALALALLAGTVLAGVSERFVSDSFTPLFKYLPAAAAILAAIIPILFYGKGRR